MPSPSKLDFSAEWTFETSRSGGKGGQHANKTETRVALVFSIPDSALLSESQKQRLMERLGSRLDQHGFLRIVCDDTRSQQQNKQIVVERFYSLLEDAIKPRKKRIPTKKPRGSETKRLKAKKQHGEKKQRRQEDKLK